MVFTPMPAERDAPSLGPYAPHEPPLMLPADVMFSFDSAKLRPEAESALQRAVQIINARPTGKNVSIEGHADASGPAAYNQRLSLERAQAVKQWLVLHGVPGAQGFAVTGYGETRPIASNNGPQGRQKNRRVEIRFP